MSSSSTFDQKLMVPRQNYQALVPKATIFRVICPKDQEIQSFSQDGRYLIAFGDYNNPGVSIYRVSPHSPPHTINNRNAFATFFTHSFTIANGSRFFRSFFVYIPKSHLGIFACGTPVDLGGINPGTRDTIQYMVYNLDSGSLLGSCHFVHENFSLTNQEFAFLGNQMAFASLISGVIYIYKLNTSGQLVHIADLKLLPKNASIIPINLKVQFIDEDHLLILLPDKHVYILLNMITLHHLSFCEFQQGKFGHFGAELFTFTSTRHDTTSSTKPSALNGLFQNLLCEGDKFCQVAKLLVEHTNFGYQDFSTSPYVDDCIFSFPKEVVSKLNGHTHTHFTKQQLVSFTSKLWGVGFTINPGNEDEETNEHHTTSTFIFHPTLPLIITKQARPCVRGKIFNFHFSSTFFC